jgi:hypothetical protein
VRSGGKVTATGDAWITGCNDTGGGGIGCSGTIGGHEEVEEPIRNIEVEFVGPLDVPPRDRTTIPIGKVDADENGDWTLDFTVPDVEPGDYMLDTGVGESAELFVRETS